MYELFQRVYTTITSFPSLFWPWNNNNSTKRARTEIIDVTDEDEDVAVVSPKKLKLNNSSMPGGTCKKNSKTQTENIKRKQSAKTQQWQCELSAKENWDGPLEVIDLVEGTPNKFKNQYRPPSHVRSLHRIRRKSLLSLKNDNDLNNFDNKILSEKRGNHQNSCNKFFPEENTNQKILSRKNWPENIKMAYSNITPEQEASLNKSSFTSKMMTSIDHDQYSKLLSTFINKSDSQIPADISSPVPIINIDLTNDSSDDNTSGTQSSVEYKNPKRHLKLFDDTSLNKKETLSSSNTKPRRMRVKPTRAGVEVNKLRSLNSITIDDDDDDDEDDSVQFIKTPPVAKVNSLEDKIKAESAVAHQKWIKDLVKNYETKRAEMEEVTKKLAMELKIVAENHRSNINEVTVKLLTRHLHVTESIADDQEIIEAALPPLTSEMRDVINKASRKQPAEEVLIEKFNYRIKRNDINTLTGLNWLNDEIINFYISLIMERSKEKSTLPKTYSFNTFFYLRLANSGYQGVKRWTKKVDIFAHDLIIIPVHLQMHWCLATIDCVNKTIKYYDSMGTNNDQCLKRLEDYLVSEHKDKKGETLSMENWTMSNVKDIPRQRNGSDCGVFSCTFAEFLSRRAGFTFDQNDMPYIRNKMIYEIVTGKLLT